MRKLLKPIIFSILLSTVIVSAVTTWDNISLLWERDYRKSDVFRDTYNRYVNELIHTTLTVPDKEKILQEFDPTQEEIENYRYMYGDLNSQLNSVKEQYEEQIAIAIDEHDAETRSLLTKERDKKLDAIRENFSSDEIVLEKMKADVETQLDTVIKQKAEQRKQLVDQYPYFVYELVENGTGEKYANGDTNQTSYFVQGYGLDDKSSEPYLITTQNDFSYWQDWSVDERVFTDDNKTFVGNIIIPTNMKKENLLPYYGEFQRSKNLFLGLLIVFFGSIVGLFIFLRTSNKEERISQLPQKIVDLPIDIKGVLFILTTLFFVYNAFSSLDLLWLTPNYAVEKLLYSSIGLFIGLPLLRNIFNNSKSNFKEEFRSTYLFRLSQVIRSLPFWSLVELKAIIVLGIFSVWGFGTALLLTNIFGPERVIIYLICMVVILLPTTIWVLYQLGVLRKLTKQTSTIIQQGVKDPIPLKGTTLLKDLTRNINELQNGIQTSQANEQKSERLKTELISNVSHDLRTPLTAIITYTDLLKKGEGTEEEKANYISILDRKSLRLKKLLDDLFEVTKMSSGNVELQREKVDLKQLIQQAVAEQEYAMKDANLELRLSLPASETIAYVDGQKIWRLVDNLLINATKYALANTRVYVKAAVERQEFTLTMKNVSSHELGENIDELVQRFKRGDTSRHTEGSGLGLAIAQSIAELHDGSLDVTLDGDLFTVTVRLPV